MLWHTVFCGDMLLCAVVCSGTLLYAMACCGMRSGKSASNVDTDSDAYDDSHCYDVGNSCSAVALHQRLALSFLALSCNDFSHHGRSVQSFAR